MIQDVTITISGGPPKITVVFNNVPSDLTNADVQYLTRKLYEQAINMIQTRQKFIDIDRARQMLAASGLTQNQFDQLTL